MKKTEAPWGWARRFPLLLLILGLIGFAASFELTVEKIALIEDPNYEPTCNISPLISCGSVMVTDQAEAFGFPNSLIGIAGFAMVSLLGAALMAGAKMKRWFWICVQVATLFGVAFVHWLFYQSVFNIGALCPYCMVVWVSMIPIFWYTLLYNLRSEHIKISSSLKKVNEFAQKHHLDLLIVWFLIIAGLILNHFWYYWKTLL